MSAPGPLRILVVEDEAPARRRLVSLVAQRSDAAVVGEAATVEEARELVASTPADVLFLDIRLHRGSGFEVLRALDGEKAPVVVFVTAYDEHAVRAFEVGAVDYLLKPFDDERFARCLERVRRRLAERRAADPAELLALLRTATAGGDRPRRLAIRGEGRTVFVEVDEIRWIEAADYYARLHLDDGPRLMRASLSELEERLDPAEFVRVHRSAIVRLGRVRELHSTFRGDAVALLDDGERVKVSRRYRATLEERLAGT